MSINISGSVFENNNTSPVSGAGRPRPWGAAAARTRSFSSISTVLTTRSDTAPAPSPRPPMAERIWSPEPSRARGKFDGKFQSNTVGVTGVANTAAGIARIDALRLFASGDHAGTNRVTGTSDTRYLVTGNTIRNYGEAGIQFNARQGNSVLDATVFGNTIGQPGTAANGAFAGIWANSGCRTAGDTNTLNIVVGDFNAAANKNTHDGRRSEQHI